MSEKDEKLLYQYTNIEALASILKNHTIRFNSLDKMDDLQEEMTSDLKNAAKFVFISSWTKAQVELIPMWKLYTFLKRGVRIGLPLCPFEKHPANKNEAGRVIHDNDFKGKDCLIPVSEMAGKNFYSIDATNGKIDYEVVYTDDNKLLYPKLKGKKDGKIEIYLSKLGKHKNTFWEFQDEVRYRFTVIPFKNMPITKNDLMETAESIYWDKACPPFSYYDMKISDEAYSKMTITLSPDIDPGIETAVRALQEKYNPNAIIVDSTLKGLIR